MRFASEAYLDSSSLTSGGGCNAPTYGIRLRHEARPLLEQRGFERVVVPLVRSLRAAALRLTRNRPDADDLVQETMLRAWRFWPRYVERDNCRAWLQRILTNTFRTEWRRGVRSRAQLSELETTLRSAPNDGERLGSAPAADCGCDARAGDALGLDDRLNSAMSALKPAQRRVLWLIDVRERSYREAAAELACPIGTVMSRLHRARAALRLQLGPTASHA
jgi:RNA polymerase sigma-70 factor (ECF subfamily)